MHRALSAILSTNGVSIVRLLFRHALVLLSRTKTAVTSNGAPANDVMTRMAVTQLRYKSACAPSYCDAIYCDDINRAIHWRTI
jgi:hypothetical protein